MRLSGIVKKLFLAMVLLGVMLATAGSAGAATGTTYYVNASPPSGSAQDCSTWANACPDLQTALDKAGSSDQIWVAAGTYKPSAVWPSGSTDSRTATFTMKDGVAIYGGFAGNETDPSQRNPDPATNNTILSGDIGAADDASDNAYHVVNTEVVNWGLYGGTAIGVTNSAVLDGFTITGGNASGSTNPKNYGGGMWLHQGSPTLRNLRFVGNSASQDGGGMYVEPCYTFTPGTECLQTKPTLTDVVFQRNTVTTTGGTGGAGMNINNYMNDSDPSLLAPSLTRVTFDGNTSANNGGGLLNNGAPAILTNVTFKNNIASGGSGGGMSHRFDADGLTLTLTNVDFINNSATDGGGLYSMNSYSTSSKVTGTNVRFLGNHAIVYGGGGMEAAQGHATLVNALFSDNSAVSLGGGIAGWGYSNTTLTNATFSGNSAPKSAAIFVGDDPTAVVNLQNSVVYGNSGGSEIPANSSYDDSVCGLGDYCGTANISNSLIQGGCPAAANCTSIVSGDPKFANPSNPAGADGTIGTTDDGLQLSAGSPAIDAGDNSYVPTGVDKDVAGQTRFKNDTGTPDTGIGTPPIVDMGAYEFQGTSTLTNNPPTIPSSPSPESGATGVSRTTNLSWTGGDPDAGDAVTYVVKFGAANPPTATVCTGLTTAPCDPSPSGDLTAGTTYYWQVVATDSYSASTTGPVWSFTTAAAPTVTTQPTNQSATVGGSATFTAAATGNPTPTVKWQVQTTASGATWSDISDATSTALTLSGVTADMNGYQYRAVFTNSAGSATSNAATLTVKFAPIVTTQPTDQSVTAGSTATFTAAANGNPTPSIQWQVSTDNGANWSDIRSAASTTYSFTARANNTGSRYRAIFSNPLGSTISKSAVLTVATKTTTKIGTTTTLTSSSNPSSGQDVTFTATVKAVSGTVTPTGSVTFFDGGTSLGTATLSGGQASFTTKTLADGVHPITAQYFGDSSFNGSTSAVLNQTVGDASDVSITKTGSYDATNKTITWTLKVTNNGKAQATGVQVEDPLASGTRVLGVNPPSGATYTTKGRTVIVNVGTLAGNGSVTVKIEIDAGLTKTPTSPVTVSNTATVTTTSADSHPNNNSSTATVTIP